MAVLYVLDVLPLPEQALRPKPEGRTHADDAIPGSLGEAHSGPDMPIRPHILQNENTDSISGTLFWDGSVVVHRERMSRQ